VIAVESLVRDSCRSRSCSGSLRSLWHGYTRRYWSIGKARSRLERKFDWIGNSLWREFLVAPVGTMFAIYGNVASSNFEITRKLIDHLQLLCYWL